MARIERKPEGHALIDQFGVLFAGEFDATLRQLKLALEQTKSPSHPQDIALRQYLESPTADVRAMKIARYALASFMHNLLARLDESDALGLYGATSSGELLNLRDYSDLFPAEMHIWCEKHSEHGSIFSDLLEIAETLN